MTRAELIALAEECEEYHRMMFKQSKGWTPWIQKLMKILQKSAAALRALAEEGQMTVSAEVPKGMPMRDEWEKYQASEEYKNSRTWALLGETYIAGALWAAFVRGWNAKRGE